MRCPRCDEELDGTPATCGQCRGIWVSRSDVARTTRADESAFTSAGESPISCPECYAPLEKVVLREVHLDRCAKHGVWFDIGEVTEVLQKAGKLAPGVRAKEDQPSTGSKVAEGAAGIGVGVLEVLGAIVDIVV